MNLAKLFFRREATVEAPTAANSATDDVLAELDAQAQREREAQAEQIARERKHGEEWQAKNAKTLGDFLKRKDTNGREVNRHVVGLLLALTDTKKLALESNNVPFDGSFKTTEDVFGFPYDFADKIIRAIYEAAPGTQWDFAGEGQPTLKGPIQMRVPRFAGDAAGPRYDANTGPWPPEKGPSATFLPLGE